LMTLFDQERS